MCNLKRSDENYNTYNLNVKIVCTIRAIPFEEVVDGVSDIGFSDHPAVIFQFSWVRWSKFSPLTQCKKQPVRTPRSDIRAIFRPPSGIFKNAHQTPSQLPFQMY